MKKIGGILQFLLAHYCEMQYTYECGEGDRQPYPRHKGESNMKLQLLALLLQIAVAIMLLVNIIHHW